MNIKSSICGIQHTCINFLIFLIITKIDCWPIFKQINSLLHGRMELPELVMVAVDLCIKTNAFIFDGAQ